MQTLQTAFPTFCKVPSALMRGLRRVVSSLWRGWRKSWRYLLGFVVFFIIFDIGLGFYATVQLNHQLDLIRQKGEPLTLEELVPAPIPDEKNAAVLYKRAQAKIHYKTESNYGPSDNPASNNSTLYTEKSIPTYTTPIEISSYLAKNAATINLIRQATTKPKCQFELTLDPYWGPNIKDASIYDLTRLLSLQARYEAETGRTDIAMQDMQRLFVMINHFSLLPINNSSQVILGRTRLANQTLAKVLLYARVSPTQARAFEASLPVIDLNPLAYRDFLIDRITSINGFESSAWPYYLLFNDNFPAETSLLKFRGMLNLITTPLRKLDEICALKLFAITYERYHDVPVPMSPKYRDAEVDKLDKEIPWYAIGTRYTPLVLPNNIPGKIETARRERIVVGAGGISYEISSVPNNVKITGNILGKRIAERFVWWKNVSVSRCWQNISFI